MKRFRRIRSHTSIHKRRNWRDHHPILRGTTIKPAGPPRDFYADPSIFSLPYIHPFPIPHPDSPAGKMVTHTDLLDWDFLERVECATEAVLLAPDYMLDAIEFQTGQAMEQLIGGILPMLALSVGVLGLTTAIGAGAGAALGALAGGVFTVPLAAAGAEAGLSGGLWLLNVLGIGFLLVYIADKIDEVTGLAAKGARTAWNAPDSSMEDSEVKRGAQYLAQAVAVLVRLLLEGIVMYLMAKGASAAASRLPELLESLRTSKFGRSFANWVENNWQSLMDNPRFKPKPKPAGAAGGEGGGLGADGAAGGGKGVRESTPKSGKELPEAEAPQSKTSADQPKKAVEEPVKPKSGGTEPSGSPGGKPDGKRTKVRKGESGRDDNLENQAADALADKGYKVRQNPPELPNGKKPDYEIEGKIFDCYSPRRSPTPDPAKASKIVDVIAGKVNSGQADRIVVNLSDSEVTPGALKSAIQEGLKTPNRIDTLKEVIVVQGDNVIPVYP